MRIDRIDGLPHWVNFLYPLIPMGYPIRLPLYTRLSILPFVVSIARRGRRLPFTVPGALPPPGSELETKSSLAPS